MPSQQQAHERGILGVIRQHSQTRMEWPSSPMPARPALNSCHYQVWLLLHAILRKYFAMVCHEVLKNELGVLEVSQMLGKYTKIGEIP